MKTKQKTLWAMLVFVLCVVLLAALPLMAGAAEGDVEINQTNFPDANFRTYVSENIDTDNNGTLSAAEIEAVTYINVREKEISDLTGIKYFTLLKTLSCNNNSLKSLDVSGCTALTLLDCSRNNYLESLDVSGCTALTWLYCNNNSLKSLDMSGFTALTTLNCCYNYLESLDVSALTSLKTLYCNNNSLKSLDVSGCTALATLICNNNSLESLDVSGCTALTSLNCSCNNYLESLDVSGCTALTLLDCSRNNSLESLDVSGCTALTTLSCNYNSLTSLDVSGCTALTSLDCSSNSLESLDMSGCTALTSLDCRGNSLESLDVSGFTALTTLYCNNNSLESLDLSNNTLLIYLSITSQAADITIDQKTMSYTMPAGFDSTKVTSVTGGVFNGDFLTVDEGATTVKYKYKTGNGDYMLEVTLNVTNPHTHTYGETVHNDFLKTPANCTNSAVYYKSCECGLMNGETFTYGEPDSAVHSFDAADVCALHGVVNISEIAFPDAAFREYVRKSFDKDGNGVLSADELTEKIINLADVDVKNLKGIEFFTALTHLNCPGKGLTSIDVSKNLALKVLHCEDNKLTSLDVSKNLALTDIYCQRNCLTSIDVSANINLINLNCMNQTLEITINPDATYIMPEGFDFSKVSSYEGGVFDDNVLKAANGETTVTYIYDTNFKESDLNITITIANPHTHTYDAATHECACGAITGHSFDENHECTCGATNHNFDETTHICTCGAITGHSFDEKHECECGATNHSYDPVTHICSCGAKLAEAVQVSLTLGGDIGVNFYWLLASDVINDPEAYFLVTLPNGDKNKILVSEATQDSPVGETTRYYKITGLVAAKEMADDVLVELYYGGAVIASAKCSVRGYANRVFALASTDESLVAMMKAMLNYGAASQTLFGHNTDKLANNILAAEDKIVAAVDKSKLTPVSMEGSVEGFTPVQFSCVLESTTTIRHYFKVEGDISYYDFSYVNASLPFLTSHREAKLTEDGTMYYVDIPNISANNMSREYIFIITKDTETIKITASVHSYMLAVLNNSEDEALINTINAMYAYGEAAKAYFG